MAQETTVKKAPQGNGNRDNRGGGMGARRGAGGPRRGGSNFERPKPEFDHKILAIRRVTRVVSGGRRMSFSVAMAIGDRKGSVGFGTGKANDTALAINKAQKAAKKNLVRVRLTKTMSIPHEVSAKCASSRVFIMPNRGKGMVAGSAVRDILVLAGIKDVTAKIQSGSKNRLNNAQATISALRMVALKGAVLKEVSEPVVPVAVPAASETKE